MPKNRARRVNCIRGWGKFVCDRFPFPSAFFRSRNWRALRREILIFIVIRPKIIMKSSLGNAIKLCNWILPRTLLKLSDRICFYSPLMWYRVVGRWNHSPRGISKNLKTLWLVQAAVATWKRDPSRFVLYCGNICSLHYKTIIVETITLHAFIFKRTACFDDCPLFSTIFKRRTAGWHFVDLWTETFKPQAKKKETFQIKHWFFCIFIYIYFLTKLLEISCCKMFNIPP